MKILFFGDSITDMGRSKEAGAIPPLALGTGYPMIVASKLSELYPKKHEVVNRGNGGNRIVDLYARIKADVWNEKPDMVVVLVGINDLWHESIVKNGVDIERFEKVYTMLIEDTLSALDGVKMVLLSPFVMKGSETEKQFEFFSQIHGYAEVVKKLAAKYGLYHLSLQEKFDAYAEKYGAEYYVYDGIHPNVAGATLIANAFIELVKDLL
ncbi:MAG: lysophospholipase [Clostridia bacterium]|nr:lysophospholipase [Clostridia bacterium]